MRIHGVRNSGALLCLVCSILPTSGLGDAVLDAAIYRARQTKYALSGSDVGPTTNLGTLATAIKSSTTYQPINIPPYHLPNYYTQEVGPLARQYVEVDNSSLSQSSPSPSAFISAANSLTDLVRIEQYGYGLRAASTYYFKYAQSTSWNASCDTAWSEMENKYGNAIYATGIVGTIIQEWHSSICPPIFNGVWDVYYTASAGSLHSIINIQAPSTSTYSVSGGRIVSYVVGSFGEVPPGGRIAYATAPYTSLVRPGCPCESWVWCSCSNYTYRIEGDFSLYARVELPPGGNCSKNASFASCGSGLCGKGIPRVGISLESVAVLVEDRPLWIEGSAGPKLAIDMSLDVSTGSTVSNGVFGKGWRWAYDAAVVNYGPGGAKRVLMPGGDVLHFFADGLSNGVYRYSGPPLSPFSLIGYTDGTFRVEHESGGGYGFLATNSVGVAKLAYVEDAGGLRLRAYYDSGGLLTNLTSAGGAELVFQYDGYGHIVGITNSAGVGATFTYTTNNLLASVVDMGGNAYTYQYASGDAVVVTNIQTVAGDISVQYMGGSAVRVRSQAGETHEVGVSATNAYERYEIDPRGFTRWVVYTNTLAGLVPIKETDALGGVKTYGYDLLGRLLAETNEMGYVTTYTYDEYGNVLTEASPLGRTNSYTYSVDGLRRLSHCDEMGHVTTYGYDADGNLVGMTNPLGGVATYVYSNGLKWLETDAFGLQVWYQYDAALRLTQTVSSAGSTNIYCYDALGRMVQERTASGLWTSNAYDGLNRVVKRTYPDNTYEMLSYSCCGLVAETNRLGYGTHYTVDAVGRRIGQTDALGNTTTYRRDENGNVIILSNTLGYVEMSGYDGLNRMTSRVYLAAGAPLYSEVLQYDPLGRMTNAIDRHGATNVYSYDALGRRLVTMVGGIGPVDTVTYDAAGRVITRQGPDGVLVSNQYDAIDRLIRTDFPDGTYIENLYAYASNGLYAARDGLGLMMIYSRDDVGRVTAVSDPAGRVTQYQYDSAGRMVRVIDQNGNATGFTFDEYNNVIAKTYADTSVWYYAYDAANHLTNRVDGKGRQLRYTYDTGGLLFAVAGTNLYQTFAYDVLGRATSRVDAAGTTTLRYGDTIHLTEVDGPYLNDTVTYTYYGDRVVGIALNGTPLQNFTWDVMGRLSEVDTPAGAFAYSYVGVRRAPETIVYPSGALSLRTQDVMGRLETISNRYSNGAAISSQRYVYDDAGRRVRETSLDGSYIECGYDLAGQLTSAVKHAEGGSLAPEYEHYYTYDPAGNMLARQARGMRSAMQYNSLNQLTNRVWIVTPTATVAWVASSPLVTGVTVNGRTAGSMGNGLFAVAGVSVVMGSNTLTAHGYDPYGRRTTNVSSIALSTGRPFRYDANGNMVSDGEITNEWDALDRLVSSTRGGTVVSYGYRGQTLNIQY